MKGTSINGSTINEMRLKGRSINGSTINGMSIKDSSEAGIIQTMVPASLIPEYGILGFLIFIEFFILK